MWQPRVPCIYRDPSSRALIGWLVGLAVDLCRYTCLQRQLLDNTIGIHSMLSHSYGISFHCCSKSRLGCCQEWLATLDFAVG